MRNKELKPLKRMIFFLENGAVGFQEHDDGKIVDYDDVMEREEVLQARVKELEENLDVAYLIARNEYNHRNDTDRGYDKKSMKAAWINKFLKFYKKTVLNKESGDNG